MGDNANIVSGETKSGIKFKLDTRIKDDSRLLLYLTQAQKKGINPLKQSEALFSLLELVFGSEDGLTIFMNEVAAKHDGVADANSLIEELKDMFEVLDLKNS